MRARTVKKLLKRGGDALLPYGYRRATGSKRLRRGRKAILRVCPWLRDWIGAGVPLETRLDWLEAALNRLEARP